MIYAAFVCSVISCAQAQKNQPVQQSISRDIIITHYLENGAWAFPMFFSEWGEYIDSALAILPQDAYLWQQKSMPYFKQRKYELGMSYLDSAVKYDPRKYLDYRAFIKCIFEKNYTASLQDFFKAKEYNGNFDVMDQPYDFYIGLCHLQLNHFDTAAQYFRSCIHADSLRGESNIHFLHDFYLGIALYEKKEYKKAITIFDRSIRNYSRFSDAKLYKALCLIRGGYFQQAADLGREAQSDLSAGYTINEDNARYEPYPYQIDQELCRFYNKKLAFYVKLMSDPSAKPENE